LVFRPFPILFSLLRLRTPGWVPTKNYRPKIKGWAPFLGGEEGLSGGKERRPANNQEVYSKFPNPIKHREKGTLFF